jgi:hypothetical protein
MGICDVGGGAMKVEFAFTMTGRQKISTVVWCGTGSALFIVPSALLPFADLSPDTVAAGVGIPSVVAVVFWLAKNLADNHNRKAGPHESARRGAVEVRRAEIERSATSRPVSAR